MFKTPRPFWVLSLAVGACLCGKPLPTPASVDAPVHTAEAPEKLFAKLLPLHKPLAPAEPGNWVSLRTEQPQSFWQYVQSGPVRATAARSVIYVLPLGDFTVEQRAAVESAQLFLAAFYQLPVKSLPAISGAEVVEGARRINPATGLPQLLTRWVLDTLLLPLRPADAVALLAFTPEDLFPDPAWNFVFGQASLTQRVGVWSIHRFSDPVKDKLAFTRRTLKVAGHETGHMLGLQHCVFQACLMNGSNSLFESDAQPLELCPVCLRKLQWNIGFDVRARFGGLSDFHRIAGLVAERAFIDTSLKALDTP